MQTHSITLGRNIPNSGTVTNQMWIEFLKNEVCTSLEYATVTEGTGIYKGELEQCMIISVQTDDLNVITALQAIGSRYKKQFNQDCILYSTTDNPQFVLTWPNQNQRKRSFTQCIRSFFTCLLSPLYYWERNVLLQMCRPQPMILYNKDIQNRISIYVQQRPNTNVQRKSSNEQNRNARSNRKGSTWRDGIKEFWTSRNQPLRDLVHIR